VHNASRFQVDQRLLQCALAAAANCYDEVAVVQREIGKRLLERLELIRLVPETIVDIGCATGEITALLSRKYRKSRVLALERTPALLARARRRSHWLRRYHCICGTPERLPLADCSCDLLFSNLSLQWSADPDRVFRECQRVLKPGGLLLFSTLGPDTLAELRQSWAAADNYTHVNAFIDMHDLGDALVRAQLLDPVMDVDRLTLTYPDVDALMRDLKKLGAHNMTAGRVPGLTGKGRLQAMRTAYEQFRHQDRLPVTCEIVYGHAWAPVQSLSYSRNDGTAVFPLAQLRSRRSDRQTR